METPGSPNQNVDRMLTSLTNTRKEVVLAVSLNSSLTKVSSLVYTLCMFVNMTVEPEICLVRKLVALLTSVDVTPVLYRTPVALMQWKRLALTLTR